MTPGDSRETPQWLFDQLNAEFHFTIDVAAAAKNAKCKRFRDERHSGLSADWTGEAVWCNPPFSDIEPWVRKAWASRANVVVMIVPANRTEQPWWQELIEPKRDDRGSWLVNDFPRLTTRFLPKRIHFPSPGDKTGKGHPGFGCVLLIWRNAIGTLCDSPF